MKTIYTIAVFAFLGIAGHSQSVDWLVTTGGSEFDYAQHITTDNQGNVYVLGEFRKTVDFNPTGGGDFLTALSASDLYVQKLDSDGNHLWVKQIEGGFYTRGTAIAIDNNLNINIAGTFGETSDFDPSAGIFELTASGNEDGFILQLDTNGNFNWAIQVGENDSDRIHDMVINDQNTIYVTGYFNEFLPQPDRNSNSTFFSDVFVAKVSSLGTIEWLEVTNGDGYDLGNGVALDNQGNVLVGGRFQQSTDFNPGPATEVVTSNGGSDAFVLKLDNDGNFMWVKTFGGLLREFIMDLEIDDTGNIITTGIFNGEADFDPGLAIFNQTPEMYNDTFIQKLDSNGNFLWAQALNGNSENVPRQIKTSSNNIYLVGAFESDIDLNPGIETAQFTSKGSNDGFFLILNGDGIYQKGVAIGSVDYDQVSSVYVADPTTIYLSGLFSNSIDFDPSGEATVGTSQGNADSFILQYNEQILGTSNVEAPSEIKLWPNPTSAHVHITSPRTFEKLSITIYNAIGQVITSAQHESVRETSVEMSGASGIYFVEIIADGISSRHRIVKN